LALRQRVVEQAGGTDGKLFSGLGNFNRDIDLGLDKIGSTSASAHDWRHASGQWLIDVGVPIELVSKFMGHASTTITERVYARIKDDQVGDRMLDALNPQYTRGATRHRSKVARKVEPLKTIPMPRLPVASSTPWATSR
jgi:hypothetical protein